ncbi:Propanoyl-CoA C-acyltransferase [Desulfarculus baarsii DSM 2075]|uniref:Propanoyl-CoA C-acyltransferase n=1 Tax=Desulfarculus baarsii (strain ATCC 33931 / DSM 2075 / LMG 7858 / VKM B-1802 / 2st14) TaxID=644282 RepID=E1QLQ0_DESB2|nr:acetyl-CoA acetyltransferase [Desulfarculus baarsii]ADK86485.1 Propanoyl-CoA C-acyltransferase [Desulfarculus baarsii DSM 2075]
MASGIKDKVAIIGMGCSRFGERWDVGAEELIVEAFEEALADSKIDRNDIQAVWQGTCFDELDLGRSALSASAALRLPYVGVTRVENFCASGTESFRGAVYAVASGAYDMCLALGVEKLKDSGYGGLPQLGANAGSNLWMTWPNLTAPGSFAQLATAYTAKYGVSDKDLKRAIAQVSVKSHENGAINPKAHLRKKVTIEQVMAAPIIAHPLGLFDCCGVSDGAACAIVTTVEKARDMGFSNPVTVKALQVAVSNGEEMCFNSWDGSYFPTTDKAADRAYQEAGISDPKEEISMMELHDCFSITEMVTYEDLKISQRGQAWKDTLDGMYNADGKVPAQIDGGLKCFGHPIGASGLRMLYEMYLQLQGRAAERQLKDPRYGLTHNLGGFPFNSVCSVAIVGRLNG